MNFGRHKHLDYIRINYRIQTLKTVQNLENSLDLFPPIYSLGSVVLFRLSRSLLHKYSLWNYSLSISWELGSVEPQSLPDIMDQVMAICSSVFPFVLCCGAVLCFSN